MGMFLEDEPEGEAAPDSGGERGEGPYDDGSSEGPGPVPLVVSGGVVREDQEFQKQSKVLHDLGFIEPRHFPYGSGVLFVPKANGKLRLCVDYRPLNAITVADVYPLPRTENIIDSARIATWYTKMDLHAGFHQIKLHPESVERTAFKK